VKRHAAHSLHPFHKLNAQLCTPERRLFQIAPKHTKEPPVDIGLFCVCLALLSVIFMQIEFKEVSGKKRIQHAI
jgi:hypothetical protein